ncbi:hypothetical protein M2475_000471 [Breznakia sp. PF5-3]|uniref:hypothetical protein n=1 Tax=unclassified Breznakia TaxID=2623764 RepID=UPI002405F417|nr:MULTISPECIES: hypothetical protein [unclassified Breznakia]MDF9824121.1 hypothetical protein [Breznakia sp. PM6-1]MDF9834919.1 hypothetical protein [Breznakia sp. PF5-3]MDF9837212.1 hypothetical protein [Breznakia sp. PFB2-8]MDF9859202.1 hypothetical protein [Breznakia sp. PH5-24]
MKKICLSIFFFALLVSGCSGDGKKEAKESTVCKIDVSGSSMEMVIVPDGKKLDEITVTAVQEDAVAGVSESERESGLKAIKEQFGEYKGTEFDISFDGDDLVLKVTLKVNEIEEFPPMLGMDNITVDDLKDTPYKTYVKNLKTNGADCKENK